MQTYHQVSNLDRKSRYEFWVTAHTDIGEGSSSSRVTSSPTERIPAKIASFDNKFTAVAKQEIRLPCMAGKVAAFPPKNIEQSKVENTCNLCK